MNKSRKILATLLAIVISTMVITPAIAPPNPPAIWLEPSGINLNTASHGVGYRFNVTAWISTLAPSYTWQFKVNFNPAHLQVIDSQYTGVGGAKSMFFTGLATVPVGAVIDNVGGSITCGESLQGAIQRAGPASDTLQWIEFEVKAVPGIGETFNEMISVESPALGNTFILDPDLNTVPNLTVSGTSYVFTWTQPGPATLAVSPITQSFGYPPPTHVIGTTFTVDVVVNSLNAGWNLGNVSTHLSYNSTLLQVNSVVFDPIWGTTNFVNNPGDLYLFASNPSTNPSGTVKIATVTFQILYQDTAPPRPFPPAPGSSDNSPLHLYNYTLYSLPIYNIPVTTTAAVDGLVIIYAFQSLVPPYLSVSSEVMGPGPSVGQLFNKTITLNDVSEFLNMVGVQFRLQYPADLIEPVAAYEGPFMPYWASQQPGSLGTFFVSFFEPDGTYGPHVLVGNMIYPDANGVWHEPMMKGTGVVAIITFRVIYQSFGEQNMTGLEHIVEQLAIGLDNIQDQNIVDVPMLPPVDGTYTILTNLPGREIDLFGGAVNSGYGAETCHPFPAPYGGQGPNMPMDLVEEQSWVCLHANVTYNYWPVQHKLVGFQVNYPDGSLYANLFAFTGENGEAIVGFRMPWPCENPESLFGVWHIYAGVQVADVYMNDTMDYHYDYLARIFKVTTDKYQYNHGEYVEVCIEYGSHAQQTYPILLKVHITDELGVVIGHFEIATTVGGAVYCQYKNYTVCGSIWIPKWAYAGIATVHTNIFDQEPMYGGAPWTPEYTGPTIAIQPY